MAQPCFSMTFDFNDRSSLSIYNNYAKQAGADFTVTLGELGQMKELLKTILGDQTTDPDKNPDILTYLQHTVNETDEPVPHLPTLEDAFTRLRSWCMRQVTESYMKAPNDTGEMFSLHDKFSLLISRFATMMFSVGAHEGNSRQIALFDGDGTLVLESMWFDDKAQAAYDERIKADQLTDAERTAKDDVGKAMSAVFTGLLDRMLSDIENAIDDKKTDRQPKSPVDIINEILNKKVS